MARQKLGLVTTQVLLRGLGRGSQLSLMRVSQENIHSLTCCYSLELLLKEAQP